MTNTIPLLHDHNEYLNAVTYLKGIEIYEKIIANLASVWWKLLIIFQADFKIDYQ